MPRSIINLDYDLIADLFEKADFDPNWRVARGIGLGHPVIDAEAKLTERKKAIIWDIEDEEENEENDATLKRLTGLRAKLTEIEKKETQLKTLKRQMSSTPLLHIAISRLGAKLPVMEKDAADKPTLVFKTEPNSTVDRLLKHPKIKINALGPYGETALHRAINRNKPEIAALLVAHHIDISIKNHSGETAYQLATNKFFNIANSRLPVTKKQSCLEGMHRLMLICAPADIKVPSITSLLRFIPKSTMPRSVKAASGAGLFRLEIKTSDSAAASAPTALTRKVFCS